MIRGYPEFTGFDWDEGNREKNRQHRVEAWECEQVFFNAPLFILDDPQHSLAENRWAAFGRTDAGRRLTVVFTRRRDRIRVISARDMNATERRYHEAAGRQE
jgi:hypothetical protein